MPPAIDDHTEAEIGELPSLSRAELLAHWRQLYGSEAPKGMSRSLLMRAIAHRMQIKRYGGPRAALVRRLRTAAKGSSAEISAKRAQSIRTQPGARLIRTWKGTTHVVDVVEGGFLWNGERHQSLSAIARAITGARWSGPRFFGLRLGRAP
jgi:hypothetical protein